MSASAVANACESTSTPPPRLFTSFRLRPSIRPCRDPLSIKSSRVLAAEDENLDFTHEPHQTGPPPTPSRGLKRPSAFVPLSFCNESASPNKKCKISGSVESSDITPSSSSISSHHHSPPPPLPGGLEYHHRLQMLQHQFESNSLAHFSLCGQYRDPDDGQRTAVRWTLPRPLITLIDCDSLSEMLETKVGSEIRELLRTSFTASCISQAFQSHHHTKPTLNQLAGLIRWNASDQPSLTWDESAFRSFVFPLPDDSFTACRSAIAELHRVTFNLAERLPHLEMRPTLPSMPPPPSWPCACGEPSNLAVFFRYRLSVIIWAFHHLVFLCHHQCNFLTFECSSNILRLLGLRDLLADVESFCSLHHSSLDSLLKIDLPPPQWRYRPDSPPLSRSPSWFSPPDENSSSSPSHPSPAPIRPPAKLLVPRFKERISLTNISNEPRNRHTRSPVSYKAFSPNSPTRSPSSAAPKVSISASGVRPSPSSRGVMASQSSPSIVPQIGCSNPSCSNPSKLLCSCNKASYCSFKCQAEHLIAHCKEISHPEEAKMADSASKSSSSSLSSAVQS